MVIKVKRKDYCKAAAFYIDLIQDKTNIVIITDDDGNEIARMQYLKLENDFSHHDNYGIDQQTDGPY